MSLKDEIEAGTYLLDGRNIETIEECARTMVIIDGHPVPCIGYVKALPGGSVEMSSIGPTDGSRPEWLGDEDVWIGDLDGKAISLEVIRWFDDADKEERWSYIGAVGVRSVPVKTILGTESDFILTTK